jgi:hypothetical protein
MSVPDRVVLYLGQQISFRFLLHGLEHRRLAECPQVGR